MTSNNHINVIKVLLLKMMSFRQIKIIQSSEREMDRYYNYIQ